MGQSLSEDDDVLSEVSVFAGLTPTERRLLKAVLQEWFGPECVKLDADRATVACDGASAVLNLAAMAVEPAAEGETVSPAAATLRDSLRLAVAHCREVNLGAV